MTILAYEQWVKLSGLARDIGGGEATVWIIGTTSVDEAKDFSIHRWSDNNGWEDIDGGGVRIDVAPDDNPWIVTSIGEIFYRAPHDEVQAKWRSLTSAQMWEYGPTDEQ
jgi:hypothetical protein